MDGFCSTIELHPLAYMTDALRGRFGQDVAEETLREWALDEPVENIYPELAARAITEAVTLTTIRMTRRATNPFPDCASFTLASSR